VECEKRAEAYRENENMTKRHVMVAVVSLLLPSSLLADDDKVEEGKCACASMEIAYALNIKNKPDNMIAKGDRVQTAEFKKNKSEVDLKKITASETNVEVGKKVELTVTPKLECTCSAADSICEEAAGTKKVEIINKEDEKKLDDKFSLTSVPQEIIVTVSKTCKAEDCEEKTCSVTIPIKIELDKNKNKK
jgi:hypothetical protein